MLNKFLKFLIIVGIITFGALLAMYGYLEGYYIGNHVWDSYYELQEEHNKNDETFN